MLETKLLIHELQLGEQLSECVHTERRSDFALMLAMLSEDAREFSQFHLPKTEFESDPSVDYRKLFNLPESQALGLTCLEDIAHFNEAESVLDNRIDDIRLRQALAPKPLAFRDDKQHINQQVSSNMSLHSQQKLVDKAKLLNNDLNFNAVKWLQNVKSSIIKEQVLAESFAVAT